MDSDELNLYQQQLVQVNQALLICSEGPEKDELLTLKSSIEELLQLTNEEIGISHDDGPEDEFAAFMAEMEKEGAVQKRDIKENSIENHLEIDSSEVEGKKCKAPHQHQWGHIAYHNAMICSIVSNKNEELKVRILFTNPTHQEMLPCPFYYNSDCKFSEEQCRFSHGEIVLYSSLQEYVEPNFELLTTGSSVLAKQKNNLWYRAKVKRIYEEKCLVKFENDCKQMEIDLEHIFPLESTGNESSDNEDDADSTEDVDVSNQEDIINNSLMVTPSSEVMGDWEKYTKGMGSKLMMNMGYIIGTGLGKNAEGRINPVSAVIFPAGKSLDHCMNLREQSGGDKNLFSVERKMKRLQRKQEIQNKKAYERQQKQQDIFTFINKSVHRTEENKNKLEDRQSIKNETSRNLNIKSVRIEEDIKRAERDLDDLRNSLSRHTNQTDVYKNLTEKFSQRQQELTEFQKEAQMIKNEQSLRDNKKKLTIF